MEITEEIAEQICDGYCRYSNEIIHQEELDRICEKCPLNELIRTKEEKK